MLRNVIASARSPWWQNFERQNVRCQLHILNTHSNRFSHQMLNRLNCSSAKVLSIIEYERKKCKEIKKYTRPVLIWVINQIYAHADSNWDEWHPLPRTECKHQIVRQLGLCVAHSNYSIWSEPIQLIIAVTKWHHIECAIKTKSTNKLLTLSWLTVIIWIFCRTNQILWSYRNFGDKNSVAQLYWVITKKKWRMR